jgi:hypothetical protein
MFGSRKLYRKGLADARKIIGRNPSRDEVDRLHEIADRKMFNALADGDKKAYNYNRGRAMGLGFNFHTGKVLKK